MLYRRESGRPHRRRPRAGGGEVVLLTVPQLAARWQVSESLIWRLIRQGRIPVLRMPPKLVRIREKDAEGAWQYVDTRTLEAGNATPSSSSRGRRASTAAPRLISPMRKPASGKRNSGAKSS